ncbi:unnamed product [Ostreococcus tauri]|uniref:Unnamed product n=1 Tax=Ostreococcus tauri TaxID=70448 RepID=A0A090LXQ3_OSTTA|nr:unnamed product [Ostreococcus tauri]CEF96660.1 unnamed product [Ostreococcus tauri]|eukprot:XP_022838222.1 unnamed product [Ostreococcus tauri]
MSAPSRRGDAVVDEVSRRSKPLKQEPSSSETDRTLACPSDDEHRPWGTPTKEAVERFAEELEVVLEEKRRAEENEAKALCQRQEATLAYERQRARALQSAKEVHFAQGEIVRLTKKINELHTVIRGLREESASVREKLKKAERRFEEERGNVEEARRMISEQRKDLQSERQALKYKDAEISRLQSALQKLSMSGYGKSENVKEEQHAKRIVELEKKIVQLDVTLSRQPTTPARSSDRELELIVQELAREELKSRTHAEAAEKLAFDLRTQLDAKTAEVINLRSHFELLEKQTPMSRGRQTYTSRSGTSIEELDCNLQQSCEWAELLCERLSTAMSSGEFSARATPPSRRTTGTPMSAVSDNSEERIRELQTALNEQNSRRDSAEKLAAKASGEVSALRQALVTAERIASAAAAMAHTKGITGAYVAGTSPASDLMTPTASRLPSFGYTTVTTAATSGDPTDLIHELEKARHTAVKERKQREDAEETIRRWSKLEDSFTPSH